MEFTIILEKMDNGQWFCQCEQVPEAVTQGATIEEAKENIKDAIEMVLAAKKERIMKRNLTLKPYQYEKNKHLHIGHTRMHDVRIRIDCEGTIQ